MGLHRSLLEQELCHACTSVRRPEKIQALVRPRERQTCQSLEWVHAKRLARPRFRATSGAKLQR